jgi:hypothetical protein
LLHRSVTNAHFSDSYKQYTANGAAHDKQCTLLAAVLIAASKNSLCNIGIFCQPEQKNLALRLLSEMHKQISQKNQTDNFRVSVIQYQPPTRRSQGKYVYLSDDGTPVCLTNGSSVVASRLQLARTLAQKKRYRHQVAQGLSFTFFYTPQELQGSLPQHLSREDAENNYVTYYNQLYPRAPQIRKIVGICGAACMIWAAYAIYNNSVKLKSITSRFPFLR